MWCIVNSNRTLNLGKGTVLALALTLPSPVHEEPVRPWCSDDEVIPCPPWEGPEIPEFPEEG